MSRRVPNHDSPTRAYVLDVDGTLYNQRAVRLRMFFRLLTQAGSRPLQAAGVWRALAAYRQAQEELRINCPECSSIDDEQTRWAAAKAGLSPDFVRACVREWMTEAPLDLLRPAMRADLLTFLDTARARGLRLAVWSDYPAAAKLEAMGLTRYFDVVVCAADAGIQRFKPHPRGLEVILERLGLQKDQIVYIGDRPEVDGAAARNAGVSCYIVGAKARANGTDQWTGVAGFRELLECVEGGG